MTRALTAMPMLAVVGCSSESTVICAPGYGASDQGVCLRVEAPQGHGGESDASPELPTAPDPFTAIEAEAALQAGLDAGLAEPLLLAERWRDAIDTGSGGGCPGSGGYSLIRGVRGCTSTEGYTFAGPADWTSDGDSFRLEVDSYILRPEGSLLSYNGDIRYDWGEIDGTLTWRGDVQGSFVDDDAEGWLGRGASVDLLAKGTGAGDSAEVLLSGGCSVGVETVLFESLVWDPTCGASGTLATLDGAGRAYRLSLDCSPCGTVSQGTLDLGQACLDLSAIAALVAQLEAP